MYIFVQLNSPLGTGLGSTFNLTANVGPVVPSTATATQLLAGLLVQVSNSATILNIVSTNGDCPTPIQIELPAPPTTTSTTSTTTIAPICQCILLHNTVEETAIVSYTNCNGQLAVVSLLPLETIQICGSNPQDVYGLDVEISPGGPCSSTPTGFECTECASDKCPTMLITNVSFSPVTFDYLNCEGVITTATVPAGNEAEPGLLNICVCGGIEFPKGTLSASVVSQDCALCKCYKIYNPTEGTLNYTFTDCEKRTQEPTVILAGHVEYQCSLDNGFTYDAGLIVTSSDYTCSILVPEKGGGIGIGGGVKEGIGGVKVVGTTLLCKEPSSYCHEVTIVGSAVIQYVNADGVLEIKSGTNTTLYLCAWEDSIVKTSGSGTITIVNTESTCTANYECEPCKCYTVYNTVGNDGLVTYYDCKETTIFTEPLPSLGSSVYYCGKYPISMNGAFAVLVGAVCEGGECELITTTTTTVAPPYSACFINCCDDTLVSIFNIPSSVSLTVGQRYYITTTLGGPSICATLNYIGTCTDTAPGYSYASITSSPSCATCIGLHPCPTTTTTAAPSYIYYTAKVLDQEFCAAVGPTYIIRSATLIIDNYVCIGGTAYQVLATTTGPIYNLTYVDNGNNSGNSCSPFDFIC